MKLLENSIKVELSPEYEVELFQDGDKNCYELLMESGDILSVSELATLNNLGLIYHSSQTDIDYEDETPEGKTITRYMDIHYFAKIENVEDLFKDCLPE